MKTIKTRGQVCPVCGSLLDAASSIDHDKKPKPGDVSICIYCAYPLIFEENYRIREPTDEERKVIMADPFIQRAIKLCRDQIKERLGKKKGT